MDKEVIKLFQDVAHELNKQNDLIMELNDKVDEIIKREECR